MYRAWWKPTTQTMGGKVIFHRSHIYPCFRRGSYTDINGNMRIDESLLFSAAEYRAHVVESGEWSRTNDVKVLAPMWCAVNLEVHRH